MARAKTVPTPKPAVWFVLAVLTLGLDQLSKLAVVNTMTLGQSIALTDFLNLVYVLNTGAAFSFLADANGWQKWFFTGLALLVVLLLGWMIARAPKQKAFATGASLIIGGAIGNVIDRLTIGAVVDFIDLHWRSWHWPAFNVADSAICLGAFLLIVDELRRVKRG
ncbi:MAG: lipoprotein signal peptidase [Betaproteobacteria bacterium]|jgi:signal peptidase II|nr:lipoprotein signal peptidase [Betaproteobacteria bacterium]